MNLAHIIYCLSAEERDGEKRYKERRRYKIRVFDRDSCFERNKHAIGPVYLLVYTLPRCLHAAQTYIIPMYADSLEQSTTNNHHINRAFVH